MVRPIVRDTFLLSQKSTDATPADLEAARDLYDTLDAHREDCVGIAGNMIGVLRRIVAIRDGEKILVFLNPEILKGEGSCRAEEGCLSLDGTRGDGPLPQDQTPLAGRSFSGADPRLRGLHGTGDPARDRPLQRNSDLKLRSVRLVPTNPTFTRPDGAFSFSVPSGGGRIFGSCRGGRR